MMIHNPWTIAMGDAKELRKTAKTLDVISEGLVSAYETRTGKDREELKKMLENETWMSAGTCVEEGFADGIYGAEAGAAASLVRPTMMSAKAHGVQEIISRIRAAEPEEDPEKEEEAKKRAEIVKRAEIARRASIAASAGI
jgi:ATP-dependent Clp protease protease subunit